MTTILISVLAPVVLLAWWVLIVTTARDNVVIPEWARLMIRARRIVVRMTFDAQPFVRNMTAAFAALAPVASRASRAMQEMRAPMAKLGEALSDDGGDGQ